jgi:hypothetical protein
VSTTAHSDIARCLLEPGYLNRMREDRLTGAEPAGRPAEELDLAKVRLFAGFVSKVQHNDLWLDLPYTRALLKLAEVEIEIFAEYRDRHLRLLQTGPTRKRRVQAFLGFLEELLRTTDLPGAPVIATMAAHERALWEVRQELTAAPEELSRPPCKQCITPPGVFRMARLVHDPLQIAAAVNSAGAWAAVPPRPHFVCYWGNRAHQRLTTTEVDEVTALVLTEIGAGTTCDSLIGRLSEVGLSPAVLAEILDQAMARTMIGHAPHEHDWASWR